jgi:hypothetical protein
LYAYRDVVDAELRYVLLSTMLLQQLQGLFCSSCGLFFYAYSKLAIRLPIIVTRETLPVLKMPGQVQLTKQ